MKKILCSVVVLSFFLLCGTLLAQYGREEDARAYPDTIDQDEREMLARADRFAASGKWENAFVQLQALLDKSAQKVVDPTSLKDNEKAESFKKFVSVTDFIGEKMRRFSPEARKIYITLYDLQARSAYKKAIQSGLEGALLDTASTYPISTIAADCFERVAELSFERGNPGQAAVNWQQAAEITPADEPKRTDLLYRAAVALVAQGNKTAAEALLNKIGDAKPSPSVSTVGIQQLLTGPALTICKSNADSAEEWLLPGKSPENIKGNLCAGTAFATRWRVNLHSLGGIVQIYEGSYWVNNIPLFDGKQVLVGFQNYICAMDINDGRMLWRTQLTNDPPPIQDGTRFSHQPGICIANGTIYSTAYGKLFAINQKTGELMWKTLLTYTKKNGAVQIYVSAPLVVDDGVFIADNVYTGEGLSYIRRYNANTGKLVWETYVGGYALARGRSQLFLVASPLAEHNGDLLLCNNLGMVARLNGSTGKVCWIYSYPSCTGQILTVYSPVVEGGIVYAAPLDSRRQFALNWETGDPVNLLFFSEPTPFLGIKNGMIISGLNTLSASTLQPEKKEFAALWKSVLGNSVINGQPVFGEKYLYLSTNNSLQVIDYNKERAERITTIPIEGNNNCAGNLIATKDLLISLNDMYVTVLAEVENELPRVEAALKQAPGDPVLHFRKGLCLENKNNCDGAFASWEKAHACAKPDDKIFGEPAAKFISEKICLKALLTVPSAKTLADKEKYYSLAVKYPAVNSEWVPALIDMAKFCEANKLIKDTARMWFRLTTLSGGYSVRNGDVDMAASFFGQQRMIELCKKEKKNSAEMILGQDIPLTAAEAGKMKEEELRQLFFGFPYSKRGLSAVAPLAKKMAESNNLASVVYLWQEAWNQAPSSETAAGLLSALEAVGNYSQAKLLLLSAKEKIGDQPAPQGNTWRNLADKKCAAPPYATLNPSPYDTLNVISDKYTVPFPNIMNNSIPIVVQGATDPKLKNLRLAQVRIPNGRYFYSPLDMTQMKPLWEKSEITLRQPNRALTDGKVLVVGGTEGVFVLDLVSGKTLKNIAGFFSNVTFFENRLYLLDNQGVLTAYDSKNLNVLFTQNVASLGVTQNVGRRQTVVNLNFIPVKNSLICYCPGKIATLDPATGKIVCPQTTTGQLLFDSEKSDSEVLFWEVSPQRIVSLLSFNPQKGTTKVTPIKDLPNFTFARVVRISDTQRLLLGDYAATLVDIQRAETIWTYKLQQPGSHLQWFMDNGSLFLVAHNKHAVVEISMKDGKGLAQTALTDLPPIGMATANDLDSGRYMVINIVNSQYGRNRRYYDRRNAESFAPTQIMIFDKLTRQVVWRFYKSTNFMFVVNGKLYIQQPTGLWRFE